MPDQAVGVQTRARAVFAAALGPAHASTLLAGERLADALDDAGQRARADVVREEVRAAAAARPGVHRAPPGASQPF
jgi:hypothetical protein